MGNETNEVMVSVPLGLFAELVDARGRMAAFAEFVNSQPYSIEKRDCAAILGFELIKKDTSDNA